MQGAEEAGGRSGRGGGEAGRRGGGGLAWGRSGEPAQLQQEVSSWFSRF